MNIQVAQTERPFAVVIVNDQISETGFLTRDVFNGGHYTSPTGRKVPLMRGPDWPSSATLIVNDSDRLVTVRRFYYSANPSASASALLVQVVFPGEQGVIRGFPHAMEDEGTPPPDTIRSTDLGGAIDMLYRSLQPYTPSIHGSRARLLSELTAD